jgi:hypothetical protein
MPPNDDQILPESLLWRKEWVYDPIPEWWMQRLDKNVVKEIVALQIQTRIRMLTLQQEALKAQADALKKASEIVAR